MIWPVGRSGQFKLFGKKTQKFQIHTKRSQNRFGIQKSECELDFGHGSMLDFRNHAC